MNDNRVEIEEVMVTNLQAKKLAKMADLRKQFSFIEEDYDDEITFDLKDGTMIFMSVRGRVYTYDVKTDTRITVA